MSKEKIYCGNDFAVPARTSPMSKIIGDLPGYSFGTLLFLLKIFEKYLQKPE